MSNKTSSENNAIADWLTVIFTAIIAVTGVLAFVLASKQLRQDREEAQVERLLNLVRQFDEEPMVSYRKSYAQKRLQGVTDPSEEYRILEFFETLGLLVDHQSLDEGDVWEDFS